MPYLSVETEVDYDPSDFWEECSSSEKKELAELVIEDGLALPIGNLAEGFSGAGSYTEQELLSLINHLWENRNFVDMKIVDELRENLRNKKVL
jgi:hypothetical protein